MTDTNSPKRTGRQTVGVPMTRDEREAVRAAAYRAHVSVAEWMRRAADAYLRISDAEGPVV